MPPARQRPPCSATDGTDCGGLGRGRVARTVRREGGGGREGGGVALRGIYTVSGVWEARAARSPFWPPLRSFWAAPCFARTVPFRTCSVWQGEGMGQGIGSGVEAVATVD